MSLGETLRQARGARQISMNQAALETRIRQSVLEALELDDFTALPPRPFLRGLLRNYALYLNLDADSVLDQYDLATGYRAVPAPLTEPAPPNQAAASGDSSFEPYAPLQPPPEKLNFPPFEIPTAPRPENDLSVAPETEPEPAFVVVSEIESRVPEPTAPLNLSQEPPTFAQRIGSTRIPEIIAVVALLVALIALVSGAVGELDRLGNPFGAAGTPRPEPSATRTIPPGSTPTGIPTLAQTSEATTPVAFTGARQTATPGVLTPTSTLVVTSTATIPSNAIMTLTIQSEGPMQAWVIADNVELYNGAVQNETRTWTARENLFVEIKNITQGRVVLNGNRLLPRNQQERTDLVRSWVMNPQGTPVGVSPTPRATIAAPTATTTPTATATGTSTLTATTTRTATLTPTLSRTPTRTATLTPTLSRTPTRTATFTLTPTLTLTPTQTRTPTQPPGARRAAPTITPPPTP